MLLTVPLQMDIQLKYAMCPHTDYNSTFSIVLYHSKPHILLQLKSQILQVI